MVKASIIWKDGTSEKLSREDMLELFREIAERGGCSKMFACEVGQKKEAGEAWD